MVVDSLLRNCECGDTIAEAGSVDDSTLPVDFALL